MLFGQAEESAIEIRSPLGAWSGLVTLTGTAPPHAGGKLAVFVNGGLVGTTRADPDWSFALDTRALPDGDHRLWVCRVSPRGETGEGREIVFATANR